MKKTSGFLTYRKKIAYSFSALIILPTILLSYFMISYNISQNEKQLSEHSMEISSVYMKSVEDMLTHCMQKLNIVENDNTLQRYLSSDDNSLSDMVEMRYYLFGLHSSLVQGLENLDVRIYRFDDNDFPDSFVKTTDLLDEDIVQKCLEQRFGEILLLYNEEGQTLHFYKLNTKINNKPLAITEVKLAQSNLKRIFQLGGKESTFRAVYSFAEGTKIPLNNSEIPEPEYDRYLRGDKYKEYLIVENKLMKSYLSFSTASRVLSPFHTPKSAPEHTEYGSIVFFFPNYPIYNDIWMIVLFLILFAGLIFFVIEQMSKVMTRRLDVIVGQARETYLPQTANENKGSIQEGDEFSVINAKMTEMLEEINRRNEKEKAYSLEKKDLETQLLQDLINPHFLYNTLDSVKWLSNDLKVSQMVDSIVDYYRMLLNKGNLFVSIDRELKIVEQYVNIQKVAYESSFRYEVEVEKDIGYYFMMKHTLQPFVENSILHGIDKNGSNGFIHIRVRRNGMFAVFEVEDNGYGAEQSRVDRVLSGDGFKGQGGYGLLNVKKRLNNVYGNQAKISIRTAPGHGTLVILRIPLRENL